MAEEKLSIPIPEVHSSPTAITEILAGCALVPFHPIPVSEHCIPVFPGIHEIILIDISLMIVSSDAGAS
jgi:hypothetical protein